MKVRSLVGYLPESNPLYYDMYVKEYLKFVCGLYGIIKNADEKIAEMIAVTGLEREQHKQIGQLSKGYKQRVGIAQALIHDPEILILDEPTSGLDPNQLQDIRALIKKLGQDKTVMFSSHIMQEVEAVSDRIIIIDKGKLVTDRMVKETSGSHQQNVLVEFDSEVSIDDLKSIEGVEEVDRLSETTYRLIGSSNLDFRKLIAEWARNEDKLVLTLKHEDESLEQIFRKHTS
jgi:ABC-2 type transport system ATP-binding protein